MGVIKKAFSALAKRFINSLDERVKKYLEKAKERILKYWNKWREVDLDEFTARFAPNGGEAHQDGNKIVIDDETNHTKIVMDPLRYVRVMDTSRGIKKADYLDINGVPISTYKQQKGETDQQFLDRKMMNSHFRIKHKKD